MFYLAIALPILCGVPSPVPLQKDPPIPPDLLSLVVPLFQVGHHSCEKCRGSEECKDQCFCECAYGAECYRTGHIVKAYQECDTSDHHSQNPD